MNYTWVNGDGKPAFIMLPGNGRYAHEYAYAAGGGFTARLSSNATVSTRMVAGLQADEWIDLATRAVFVEFALENEAESLVATAIFVLEFLPSGRIVPSYHVHVSRQRTTLLSNIAFGAWVLLLSGFPPPLFGAS